MSKKHDARISWKKEVAALAMGLLLGSAWEAAHAGVPIASATRTGPMLQAAPARGS